MAVGRILQREARHFQQAVEFAGGEPPVAGPSHRRQTDLRHRVSGRQVKAPFADALVDGTLEQGDFVPDGLRRKQALLRPAVGSAVTGAGAQPLVAVGRHPLRGQCKQRKPPQVAAYDFVGDALQRACGALRRQDFIPVAGQQLRDRHALGQRGAAPGAALYVALDLARPKLGSSLGGKSLGLARRALTGYRNVPARFTFDDSFAERGHVPTPADRVQIAVLRRPQTLDDSCTCGTIFS